VTEGHEDAVWAAWAQIKGRSFCTQIQDCGEQRGGPDKLQVRRGSDGSCCAARFIAVPSNR